MNRTVGRLQADGGSSSASGQSLDERFPLLSELIVLDVAVGRTKAATKVSLSLVTKFAVVTTNVKADMHGSKTTTNAISEREDYVINHHHTRSCSGCVDGDNSSRRSVEVLMTASALGEHAKAVNPK